MPLSRRMGSFHFVGTSRSLLRYFWAHLQRIFQLTAFSLQLGHVLMGESMEQGWHGVHSCTKQTFYFGVNPFSGVTRVSYTHPGVPLCARAMVCPLSDTSPGALASSLEMLFLFPRCHTLLNPRNNVTRQLLLLVTYL